MVHRACLELPLSHEPTSKTRSGIPRFPHGSPPQNAFAVWSPIVKCTFFACFLLFSRAFLFESRGHLSFPKSANGNEVYAASPLEYYQDTLPPSWNPVMAVNLTSDLDPSTDLEDQGQAMSLTGANETAGVEKLLSTAASCNNSVETDCILAVPLSSAIYSTPATQLETDQNPSPDLEGLPTDFPLGSILSDNPVTFASTGIEDNNSGYRMVDNLEDPFFSLEEYDGDGEIFALKIWVDRKEHLRAKLGKADYCQASSGIKCLSEN